MKAALFAVGCMLMLDAAARLNASHPIYRIALRMEARQNNDSFLSNHVEEGIRELPQQCPAGVLIHRGISERISFDAGHARVCRTQELKPQSLAFLFVPIEGFLHLTRGFWTNNYFVAQADLRSLSLNSSQEMPSLGFWA